MIQPYHPHLCDLAEIVSEHGAGRIRNGHVVITKAKDGVAPKPGGFCVGTIGISGIAHFKWNDNTTEARTYLIRECDKIGSAYDQGPYQSNLKCFKVSI